MSIVQADCTGRRSRRSRRCLQKAVIEALESRVLLSTYVVTGLEDGSGTVTSVGSDTYDATTLRGAINAANSAGGNQTITFDTGVTGVINLSLGQLELDDTSGT